ncbi:hypothetical protein RHGRI_001247 [Rhododendron griersonianum]|uniref:Non-haem dioxygenase N-terminal domain-containing protein n=1 Tax=Rhododendron griersonianum TaxID=479676 RepID=A0AAV6LJI5_9ERIC|nr:hypothetical protein RHGRI_001247 [Rhododendron griersonianum]
MAEVNAQPICFLRQSHGSDRLRPNQSRRQRPHRAGVETILALFVQSPESLPDLSTDAADNLRVPVISLDSVKNNGGQRAEVVDEIREAAGTWGFFQIANHGVPPPSEMKGMPWDLEVERGAHTRSVLDELRLSWPYTNIVAVVRDSDVFEVIVLDDDDRGVQSVDVQFEKGEVTVKGSIDEKEMHKRLEKLSKKKVEIVDNKAKITKEVRIHDVKMDAKAQTITIEGSVEPEKLLTFMQERVHKHAEIIPPKQEKKEEKKEEKKKLEKEEDEDKKKKENQVEKKDKLYTVQVKKAETRRVVEFKEEAKVEGKTPEGNVPYFVHYVYAPQTFSEENPNACSIM